MKGIVSYSLYGINPKYTVGAIKNAALVRRWYPGWQARFYVGDDVPQSIREQLTRRDAVVIPRQGDWPEDGQFWRFFAADNGYNGPVIFRDVDSRIGFREFKAVEAWLESDFIFHVMRDHPCHCCPVMAGMWGVRGGKGYGLKSSIRGWLRHRTKADKPRTDQDFLADVWPAMGEYALQHGSYFQTEFPSTKPFPTPYSRKEGFVGEVFDAEDQPRLKDRQERGDV